MLVNKAAYILVAIFCATQITACSADKTVHSTIVEVQNILASRSGPDSARLQRAVGALTKGLLAHPESGQLLRQRANMYASLREYKKAISDLKRADSLEPLPKTLKLYFCMLIDRTDKKALDAKKCYTQVVDEFAKADQSSASPSANYVVAALLADAKNAAELKEKYLSSNTSTNPVYAIVKNFNHKTYIHTILP